MGLPNLGCSLVEARLRLSLCFLFALFLFTMRDIFEVFINE